MTKKPKPKFLTIRVTAADIKKGKPRDGKACPVFLAAKRARLGIFQVGVFDLYFAKNKIPVPPDMRRFIDDFDYGAKVKPRTFKVSLE